MKPGDAVEVSQIIASGGTHGLSLRRWCKGYTFVRAEGEDRPPILRGTAATCLVRITGGTFDGCEVRHDVTAVRPVAP